LLEALRTIPGIEVGDNVPYSGQLKGDTLYRHGTTRGLAHALVEIRQDLILAPEGQAEWGMRLAHVLRTVLSDASSALHAIELHGSLTDGVPGASAASGPARNGPPVMDERTKVELEAAAFRRLVGHLRARTDVQNIDLMELAGFCRNCLAAWYQEAAAAKGLSLSKEEAREIVYGLAYETWKAKHQSDASARAGLSFSDSQGIPIFREQCESCAVAAAEDGHGAGLQSGFARPGDRCVVFWDVGPAGGRSVWYRAGDGDPLGPTGARDRGSHTRPSGAAAPLQA